MDKQILSDAVECILTAGFVICKAADLPDNEATMNAVWSAEEVVDAIEDSLKDLEQD